MKARLLTMILLFLSTVLFSQSSEDSLFIRKIANEVLSGSTAYENLRKLTKDVGGRLAGSPQMYMAENWAMNALKEAGAEKVWKQECQVPRWVRGPAEIAYFTTGNNRKVELDVLALGNSVGTGSKLLSAPVILINSFDELQQRQKEVKGKIVFYNYAFRSDFIKTFQAYSDAVKYRGQGPSMAARYGAVGVIVRSMSHAADNNPHTGGTNYNDSFPKIPAFAVGLKDADKLASAIKSGETRVFMQNAARMMSDTTGHNIIGEIRGSILPDEYITIGGHLDSWDVCEGAHDDGAGCVQSIEVLRAFKATGYKPKRTIRIVLFANEENGLRGGNRYAEEAKAKNEKHVFALESDAGGFTPRGFGFTVNKSQYERIQQWLPLFVPYGISELNPSGGGADIGPLNRQLGTPVAGLQPDSQRYFDIHHARSDVFEAVNKRELELGALNMAALVYLVDKYGL